MALNLLFNLLPQPPRVTHKRVLILVCGLSLVLRHIGPDLICFLDQVSSVANQINVTVNTWPEKQEALKSISRLVMRTNLKQYKGHTKLCQ